MTRGFNKPVGSRAFQLAAAAIAPKHARRAHAVCMRSRDIETSIANHDAAFRLESVHRQNMGNEFRLVIESAARLGAMDAGKAVGQIKMFENAPRERGSLRCRQIELHSGLANLPEGIADAGIRLTSEKSVRTVVRTICRYRLVQAVVAIGLEERTQNVLKWQTDHRRHLWRRLVAERAKRRAAACQNARF